MKYRNVIPEKLWFILVGLAGLIAGSIIISTFNRSNYNPLICTRVVDSNPTTNQLNAILHYATSKITPQQSIQEIRVSFDVLQLLSPCNFLVFGLGFDSQMWAAFNPRGTTLFLEEDPKWVQTVLKDASFLHAHTVTYRTQLREADDLIKSYRKVPSCSPENAYVNGNTECKLAVTSLPDEVYDKEWDLIMIDAPRGWFPEAPGRMGAIWTAAVMARNRKGPGVTHVFLHDMDRKVEKMFALEFLCKKYLVKSAGRLWHFEIPSMANVSSSVISGSSFC
ncbi:hypothetical protein MKX01_016729 [Papaver californicum]|nr:hypothetical protein MKX01_016729 [Papaver californicum]